MVGDNTDTFAYVGHKTTRNDPIKIVLFTGNSPEFKPPAHARLIKAPSDKGIVLLRHLVRNKNDSPRIDALRKSIKVVELGAKG